MHNLGYPKVWVWKEASYHKLEAFFLRSLIHTKPRSIAALELVREEEGVLLFFFFVFLIAVLINGLKDNTAIS